MLNATVGINGLKLLLVFFLFFSDILVGIINYFLKFGDAAAVGKYFILFLS